MDSLRYLVHLAYVCLILIIIALAHRWGYRMGYLQGTLDVYHSFAEDGTEGTCYIKGGCDVIQVIPQSKRHTK